MTLRAIFLFASLTLVSFSATPYEQATHALLTQRAIAASNFGVQSPGGSDALAQRLGLNVLNPTGNDNYFAFVDGIPSISAFQHSVQQYEKDVLDSLKFLRLPILPETWLMYGAIREDDNPSED